MGDDVIAEAQGAVPRIPASAGALIFDADSRLLILKPNYKKGWTIPGGQIDPGGESPWEACRRETREECGLEVVAARLVCVDFLRPKPTGPVASGFCSTAARSPSANSRPSGWRSAARSTSTVLLRCPRRLRCSADPFAVA